MEDNISKLKGVGPQMVAVLGKAGITTLGDLVNYKPRRYEDYSQVQSIDRIQPGEVSLRARLRAVSGRSSRRGLHITEAHLEDETGSVKAVWFNQPYRARALKNGQEYFCSGTYGFQNGQYQLVNPSLELVGDMPLQTARVLPIYPETKDLKSHFIRKLVAQLSFEKLPFESLAYDWPIDRRQAFQFLHQPASKHQLQQAQDFFRFEELFAIVLAAGLMRAGNARLQARSLPIPKQALAKFVKKLPFTLTDAQRRVAWQIITDIHETQPMNRLVEGDVGSGKTVVAALAAFQVMLAGSQVALMAPTEVLARQHAQSLQQLLGSSYTVALMTGSLAKRERSELSEAIRNGEVHMVVGTHALIQSDVVFNQLDLVIIDEQHRFGVDQHKRLALKSHFTPHILTMTATPIPRTLALTLFGDLDISIIDEMPKHRQPVQTVLTQPSSKKPMYEHVCDELRLGRQAFVIYPLVEESEVADFKSVVGESESLAKTVFKDFKVGMLHGRMKSTEKDAVMTAFKDGEFDVLVATTVIEVGVDVPNATVMIIEHAERFGLAQLHQLRGRVGRGVHGGHCYLVPSPGVSANRRLRALEATNDGFKLAELDLEIRGPGSLYGTMQHGKMISDIRLLTDARMTARAKELAAPLIQNSDKLLQYPYLANIVNSYRSVTQLN